MPQVTPRIHYANWVTDAETILSASSEQTPVYGVTNLRDPTPTRQWWSRLGWNVRPSFNNKLYFTEAGVARIATIATGNYASGTTYAAAVQTAMNAAPGATNTYTVTYNTTTKFFTIARATGSNALVLSFASSLNQDSAHPDLGFNNQDRTGSTSYQGNAAAYKSREWVLFTRSTGFWSDTSPILISHSVGQFATPDVYFQRSDSGPTFPNVNPAAGDLLLADQLTGQTQVLQRYIGSELANAARLLFNDVRSNTSGISRAGIFFFGPYLQPGRSFTQGWTLSTQQLSRVAISDTGTVFQDLKAAPRVLDVEFRRLSRADRDALIAFQEAVRIGGSFFLARDPQNEFGATLYGYLTGPLAFTQRVGDGNPPDRFDVGGFQMQEHL